MCQVSLPTLWSFGLYGNKQGKIQRKENRTGTKETERDRVHNTSYAV